MWTDPIVEEVRANRREIEKRLDDDFKKIYNYLKREENKYKDRLVSVPLIIIEKEEKISI